MLTVGDRLRISREKKILKQTQVRERTGINNKTLSGYEKGVSEPDFDTIKMLADLYEVSVDFLIGRTNTSSQSDNNFKYDPLQAAKQRLIAHLENVNDPELIESLTNIAKNIINDRDR